MKDNVIKDKSFSLALRIVKLFQIDNCQLSIVNYKLSIIIGLCLGTIASLFLVNPDPAPAQIIPDNSLGTENSRITPDNINGLPTDRIDGGAIRGSNLFHSFSEFNIEAGKGAYFSNPNGIDNIFSRVTGSNRSNINGTLGVLGNANLFFINPNGIVFGANARLDLRGSFLGSTASSILFENGLVFNASNPEVPPLLTVSIPIGLQLRTAPGDAQGQLQINGIGHSLNIANLISEPTSYADLQLKGVNQTDSGLQVPPGQTLALIGGEVTINGGIVNANSGSIEISAVVNGNISINTHNMGWSFDYPGGETWGNIQLRQQAFVNLNGDGDNSLFMRGDRLNLHDNSIISVTDGNIYINAVSAANIKDGLIFGYGKNPNLNNGNLWINGEFILLDEGGIMTVSESGIGGNIEINTNALELNRGTIKATSTLGLTGGNILIRAAEYLTAKGRGWTYLQENFIIPVRMRQKNPFPEIMGILTATLTGGKVGDITIETGNLNILDGGLINTTTFNEGEAGNVTLYAREKIEVNSSLLASATFGSGRGGDITMDTANLIISNGGGIFASTHSAGDAGNIWVKASETVDIIGTSADFQSPSTLTVNVAPGATGNGGNLSLETGRLLVAEGGQIAANTSGLGNGGSMTISAREGITVEDTGSDDRTNTGIFASVEAGATGNGGNLTIVTPQLRVVDGAHIATNTAGAGDAGSLTVRASAQVEVIGTGATTEEFTGLFALVEEGATGQGGNLSIETDRLSVKQGGEIGAGTFGIGNGGELTLKATDSIEVIGTDLEGFPANIYTDTLNAGIGGNLTIETPSLIVRDGGQISAGTFGSGQGGNMQIRATDTISLTGSAPAIPDADNFRNATGTRFPSGLFASTSQDATGNAGNMTLETQELRVIDGAEISASTFGSGNAGNLTLKATASVILSSPTTTDAPLISLISADTRSSGQGGTLTIETPRLRVADGSQISTRTFGAGPGGALMVKAGESVTLEGTGADGTRSGLFVSVQPGAAGSGGTLNLETQRLRVLDGALVEGSTLGDGNAGLVNIRAWDTVELIGATPVGASGLFASAVNGSGQGGDLSLVTEQLFLRDGGTIAASNFHSRNLLPPGTGPAGNIQITADSIFLANGASLNALAAVGDKGNMTINARNIQLQQNSQLNTNAQGTATGGNITINTEILAALEDSNISANAQQSFGGSITINARGIFGAKFRNQQTPDSDITATSELGASFNGTVEINTPAVDPSSGLVTLPENFADIANLIDRDPCTSGGESSFTITGRGGLPPNPTDLLSSDRARSSWIDRPNYEPHLGLKPNYEPHLGLKPNYEHPEIILARGWTRNDKGEIVLTSYDPTGETPQRPGRPPNRICSLK